MVTAIFVQPGEDGAVSRLELDQQLKTYQTLVDGYIETIQAARLTFIVDEEGKVKNKPINEQATRFLYTFAPEWRGQDVLVGPVILIGETEDGAMSDVPLYALIYFGLDT